MSRNPYEVSEETKVGFGKHRGKTHGELLKEDREYCKWIVSKKDDKDFKYTDTLKWLEDQGVKAKLVKSKIAYDPDEVLTLSSLLPFGKHKGVSYKTLFNQQREYCTWVVDQGKDFRYSKVREFIIKHMNE